MRRCQYNRATAQRQLNHNKRAKVRTT